VPVVELTAHNREAGVEGVGIALEELHGGVFAGLGIPVAGVDEGRACGEGHGGVRIVVG
jgi:hypothetical protein